LAGLQERLHHVPRWFSVFDHYSILSLLEPGESVALEIVRGALDGPLQLGDVRVTPATFGLNPPREIKLKVTLGRKEESE
jgi:hypothetical protein